MEYVVALEFEMNVDGCLFRFRVEHQNSLVFDIVVNAFIHIPLLGRNLIP